MKRIATTILRICGQGFLGLALFAFATVGTAFAATITKTFEFGEGTPQAQSSSRGFTVPCGLSLIAGVKFKRNGPAGSDNDVPIVIELRSPGRSPDEVGPIQDTRTATARRNEQTETLESQHISDFGCSLPWRVRVRHSFVVTQRRNATAEPLTVAVTGSIAVDFDDTKRDLVVSGGDNCQKGESVTLPINYYTSISQGSVVITATWVHGVGGFQGPLPVKLKFELIDGFGRVVATDTGYSNDEINPCCSGNKMKIVFHLPECPSESSNWKLRITNNTNEDADSIVIKATLKPYCF